MQVVPAMHGALPLLGEQSPYKQIEVTGGLGLILDGADVGVLDGKTVGSAVGASVGAVEVGEYDGGAVGEAVGTIEGGIVGQFVGPAEGRILGRYDEGLAVGTVVGAVLVG